MRLDRLADMNILANHYKLPCAFLVTINILFGTKIFVNVVAHLGAAISFEGCDFVIDPEQ